MTINIAVVTSEALVMGCDSIASTSAYLVDPFASGVTFEPSDDGTMVIKGRMEHVALHITGTRAGFTKMFQLSPDPCPVVAVTSGRSKLSERTIGSLAHEFLEKQEAKKKPATTVKNVVKLFKSFMRRYYTTHFADSQTPEQYWDSLNFLVGGYGGSARFASLYRLRIKENDSECCYERGKTGIAWAAQSDAVERLLRGYDANLRAAITRHSNDLVEKQRIVARDHLAQVLGKSGVDPGEKDLSIPEVEIQDGPWEEYGPSLEISNLPAQDAVNLAAYLVNLQSGRHKFDTNVATVGGRTHVGLVTKQRGFRMLNEPELVHRNIGFSTDEQ